MSTSDNPWIDFAKTRPEKGLVEWRMPSLAVPGMVVLVAAHMRKRGAGFGTVLSPVFDYWDGYRVLVPAGLQWRKAGLHTIRTCDEKVIGIEGLDVAPCIYCGKTPAIQTCDQRSPHQSGAWRFQCCGWGGTPIMKDPREIEKVRRTAFSRAAVSTNAVRLTDEAERDAMAAKLKDAEHDRDEFRRVMNGFAEKMAELEGQEPVAWMNAKRDMTSFIHFNEDDLPLYARPVPSEPVNARLLEALKRAKDSLVAFKFVPGDANCWETSDEENLAAVNSTIAAAEAAHTEPVNVDFGKRGENMFFKIGNQLFLLDYKPEEQDEFDCMKAILLSAFSRITQGVKTEIQPVNVRLLEAIKRLSFCAQTTGGTAGRDEGLCAAIGGAEKAIAAAEAQQERPGA